MKDLKTLLRDEKLTFEDAREGANHILELVKLNPPEKDGWVSSFNYFLRVMDIRSMNNYSIEAQQLRKKFDEEV